MGVVLGLVGIAVLSLALISRATSRVHVQTDPNVEAILGLLPGANCGACGNPSCFSAAESIAAGRAPADTCLSGGSETAQKIAEVLGGYGEPVESDA
jgi:Na+-translocating ferredoxin:NAD+ oxidoreductase RNF subunit RnfB